MTKNESIAMALEALEWLEKQHDTVDGGELNYHVGGLRGGGTDAVKALRAENAELRTLLNRVYAYISEYLGKHAEMFEGLAIMDAIEALGGDGGEDG